MIRVVCTGKGAHREFAMNPYFDLSWLTPATRGDDGSIQWGESVRGDWHEAGGKPGEPLKNTYTFTCRRCDRETRVKANTLRTALDGLHAKGQPALDISQLPF
jgi:hypothetical protein